MGEFINPADVPKVKFYTGDEAPCIGMHTDTELPEAMFKQ